MHTYLRPVGPLGPAQSRGDDGHDSFVAGGLCSFAACELIRREGRAVSRQMLTARELLASSDPHIVGLRTRLLSPRPPLAGLHLSQARIMGIVNVTPDSFSDGGNFFDAGAAIAHGLELQAEGAEILDIGGESTRPGSDPVDVEEECRRVIPVVAALSRQSRARISVDTRNAVTMQRAIDAGAHIVNDVSALMHDAASLAVVARAGVPVILMHMLGDPKTMQLAPAYDDVVLDVFDHLEARIAACEAAGLAREHIVVDPGIGFGKTPAHNLSLLRALSILHGLGCAVLLGASRKGFITKLMAEHAGVSPPAAERLPGSLAAALGGITQGAHIVRVHDVAATRQAMIVQHATCAST